jgi:hypothetical protein
MENQTSEKPAEKVEGQQPEPKPKSGKAFFHKHGVNNHVPRPNGTTFKFDRLADSQGVLVLDPDTDDGANAGEIQAAIKELRGWIAQKKFGLREVNESEFADLKKNLALPAAPASASPTVRIFEPVSPLPKAADPLPAQPAPVQAGAPLVADEKSATSVAVEVSSAEAAKPRVGRPVPARSRGPAAPPPPAS